MVRKTKHETVEEPPTSIDPYQVLGIENNATQDQIKAAYRKQALKHHPDKTSQDKKDEAHKAFQEIAFAYAILSDERRRKRYDTTGNTSDSLDLEADDFNWSDFYREQTAAMVDGHTIERIKKEYQGSKQEEADVLLAYEDYQGDMDGVYEEIMCSNILKDDDRFRTIIDQAIDNGKVQAHSRYTKESKASKRKRKDNAKKEASEAMKLADKLGVTDKLFGSSEGSKGESTDDALRALIMQRQKGRAENFFDDLEAKYGGSTKGKRKVHDEPPEVAFQNNAKAAKRTKK